METYILSIFYSREQRAKRTCLHVHLATAARVKYPAALLRSKCVLLFDIGSCRKRRRERCSLRKF